MAVTDGCDQMAWAVQAVPIAFGRSARRFRAGIVFRV
jgi:hypothetical protein